MTSIVRNQWYVAAYGREVGRELFCRTICGEPILFWRTEAGEVTAMSDRCVHRRFPLSESPSHLDGDTVVCGYHGFTYGTRRRLRAVPGQTRVPRTARLQAYPVVEQDSLRLGLDRRPGPGGRRPHPARAVARPGRLDDGLRHGAARRPLRACWSTT